MADPRVPALPLAGARQEEDVAPADPLRVLSALLGREVYQLDDGLRGKAAESAEVDVSERSTEVAEDTDSMYGSSDSLVLYPPTPDHTPMSSPRSSCAPQWPSAMDFPGADAFSLGQCVSGDLAFEAVVPAGGCFGMVAGPYADEAQQCMPHSAPGFWDVQAPNKSECDAKIRALKGSDEEAVRAAVEWVADKAWPLAVSACGCRVFQAALEVASAPEGERMALAMRGRVWEAVRSPYANHCLQGCISNIPSSSLDWMVHELAGLAPVVARHRFGCRVLERLIEHFPTHCTEALMNELLADVWELSRHNFGNFVVQHLLEHGTVAQQSAIVDVLVADVQRLSRHRVASHVVRAALVQCADADRNRLIATLRADPAELADLVHHRCGSFVAREMKREMRK